MFELKDAYNIVKRYRLTVCTAAAVILIAMLIPPDASAIIPPLPPDESGLFALLEEGEIDTLQYELLLVYYALPLSVPQGELALLVQVFPDIEGMIPVAREELEQYQPFDNRQVQRLFSDYPLLADAEPILRFGAPPPARQGASSEVVVGINSSGIDAIRGHRARFRHKGRYVSIDGAAAFNDSAAAWQSRRVEVPLGRVVWEDGRVGWEAGDKGGMNMQIGNFKQKMPGELMLGRFSPSVQLLGLKDDGMSGGRMSDVAANWLYGGINSWNGVALDVGEIFGVPMVGASAFYHHRLGEVGWGGGVDVRVGRQVKVFLGLTGFELGGDNSGDISSISSINSINSINNIYGIDDAGDIDDDYGIDGDDGIDGINNHQSPATPKRYYAAHLHGEYKAGPWRVATEAALPLGSENIIPALSLRVNYRIKESSAEYRLISYPSEFMAPMSRVKKQILSEIGAKESPQSLYTSSIQKHALRMVVPLIDHSKDHCIDHSKDHRTDHSKDRGKDNIIKLIPEIDFTESAGSVRRVRARAEARARLAGSADISVKHSSKIFTDGIDSVLHTTGVSINVLTDYPIEIRAAAQSAYGYYKNAIHTYTIELPCTMLKGAVIAPYIKGKYVLTNEYSIGVKSEFYLSQKTWTSVTLELPINTKGDENVYIKGSSSYAF